MSHRISNRLLGCPPDQADGVVVRTLSVLDGEVDVDTGGDRRSDEIVERRCETLGPKLGRIDLDQQRTKRSQAASDADSERLHASGELRSVAEVA